MGLRAIPLNTGDPCRKCMGTGRIYSLGDDCDECDGTGDRARILIDPSSKHAREVMDRIIGLSEGGE